MNDGTHRLSRFLSSDPHLVEVGRAHVEGRPPPRLFSWQGDIAVALDGDRLWLDRRHGIIGSDDPLVLAVTELKPLDVLMRHWAAERDGWHGFDASHGPPPYGRTRYWYEPPGHTERRQLPALTGRDEVRPRRAASRLGAGVEIIADIFRVGEQHAPSDVRVGLRYRVTTGVDLDAVRQYARLGHCEGDHFYFSTGDEKLVSGLCRLAR